MACHPSPPPTQGDGAASNLEEPSAACGGGLDAVPEPGELLAGLHRFEVRDVARLLVELDPEPIVIPLIGD